MRTISDLRRHSDSLDVDGFTKRYPAAAFVLETDFDEVGEARIDTPGEQDLSTTTVSSRDAVVPTIENATLVFFLEKSDRNPFSGMITIGRAPNNDLVIPLATISKLHATITRKGDALCLRDEGSTNGTRLDGRLLDRGENARLSPGASVALAPGISLRFHSPDSLYALVAS